MKILERVLVLVVVIVAGGGGMAAQNPALPQSAAVPPASAPPSGVPLPSGYVIGPEDVLAVVFWREKDWSADVVVRPDGKISLPVLNDVPAAGLTPEQLAKDVAAAAGKYINAPNVTVVIKEIRSRKVFVVGEVGKPGSVQLGSDMTVLQVLSEAGGLLEHAKRGGIIVVRTENGREQRFKFNYNDVVSGKRPEQNIKLRPGDTIIVR